MPAEQIGLNVSDEVKTLKVFVASPGDVMTERDEVGKVLSEINLTLSAIAPERRVVLELVRWETNVPPGLGDSPQDVVNQWIGAYDLFVGIMWKRFGTATPSAGSGTEEEFQHAVATWEKNKSLPVLFYFSQAHFAPPKTVEDVSQLVKVVEFHKQLAEKNLVWEYAGPQAFADILRQHLILVVGRMLSPTGSAQATAEQTGQRATRTDLARVRDEIASLAHEYDDLRKNLPSGDERTSKMTLCESRMRASALAAYPLLPDLILSERAGERLAAVAILKEIPDAKYLTWLANRVGVEKPFIGYHATVALLNAARSLEDGHRSSVLNAVSAAQQTLRGLAWYDPNQVRVLNEAAKELGGGPNAAPLPGMARAIQRDDPREP